MHKESDFFTVDGGLGEAARRPERASPIGLIGEAYGSQENEMYLPYPVYTVFLLLLFFILGRLGKMPRRYCPLKDILPMVLFLSGSYLHLQRCVLTSPARDKLFFFFFCSPPKQ